MMIKGKGTSQARRGELSIVIPRGRMRTAAQ